MTPARLLIVEDDRVVARDIRDQLTRSGHTVVGVTARGEDAVALAGELRPDLVLMDIRLESQLDGIEAARLIHARLGIPVVFLTAYADDQTLERATQTEPFGYLLKPFEDSQLRTSIEMALFKSNSERKLRESERRYAVTLASIGDAVIATDDACRVTYLNPVAEELTGWTNQEATGRALGEVFPVVDEQTRLPVEDPARQVLRSGRKVGLASHAMLIARDGREIAIDDCGAPIIDDQGAVSGVVVVFRDITQRRLAERAAALQEAKDQAEAANRAKDQFLANVSHEIRTPMNAILGMTELVLDTPLAEGQRHSLRTVHSAARNLLGIINDLLDFSKIEAGKLELDPGDLHLRSAIGDILRALAARAHRKGLELVCNIDGAVPDALIGDAGRLRQILMNLVGNAIKFTERGEIVVEVDAAPLTEGAPDEIVLRFRVRDTGVGISPANQANIFRAFEQEDPSTTRRYGGTGLGLTIAASLIALMHGELTLDSNPGRGSTFTFTARLRRQPNPLHPLSGPGDRPTVRLRGLRVLIVDDNAVNRLILEQWLRNWAVEPTAVGDGMAALDALWHGVASGRPYTLVLLDARMPDTDGLTVAAKIRERQELSASRIILMTSGDRPSDLERYRELRIEAHLLKPVPQDELLDAILEVMSRDDREPAQPAPAAAESAPPLLNILVAEDDEFNSHLMEKLLTKKGYRVRVASDGRETLRLLDEEPPDLLLLDLHMPELDGFQVIDAIRERERSTGTRLPVIAVTARTRQQDRDRCLAAGMDEFLSKPIEAGALWMAIDRLLGTR